MHVATSCWVNSNRVSVISVSPADFLRLMRVTGGDFGLSGHADGPTGSVLHGYCAESR